jgi:hypothetical protein
MSSIKKIGFFHFGSVEKNDPIRSFEVELQKEPGPQWRDSLIVLPEAFNVLKGYYSMGREPELDPQACSR